MITLDGADIGWLQSTTQGDALFPAVIDAAAGQAGLERRGMDDLRHSIARAVAGMLDEFGRALSTPSFASRMTMTASSTCGANLDRLCARTCARKRS
jgi:hypothetical protein